MIIATASPATPPKKRLSQAEHRKSYGAGFRCYNLPALENGHTLVQPGNARENGPEGLLSPPMSDPFSMNERSPPSLPGSLPIRKSSDTCPWGQSQAKMRRYLSKPPSVWASPIAANLEALFAYVFQKMALAPSCNNISLSLFMFPLGNYSPTRFQSRCRSQRLSAISPQ